MTAQDPNDDPVTGASAAGTDSDGDPIAPEDQVAGTDTVTALTQEPGVLVTKLASPADVLPVAGETITYTITVENTGNVTLMSYCQIWCFGIVMRRPDLGLMA